MYYALVKIKTVGREYFEDEMGPTLGYDGIETFHEFVPMDGPNWDDQLDRWEDREIYSSCEVVATHIEADAIKRIQTALAQAA